MNSWLHRALDYVSQWLEFQMRQSEMAGCVIAVVHKQKVVLERAFGHADALRHDRLTPRHRVRVASHSKSFTAAAIMRLRERGGLRLDDPVGRYVKVLHPAIARATISHLLSHSAGIVRDGSDSGQWQDRRPFLDADELRAALAAAPVIEANSRFKYSNHGFGLAGLVIEAVTGEPYAAWIGRELLAPAGLDETTPDMPAARGAPMAVGHSAKLPLGRRVVVPADNRTNALAPATGFISTARDLARFFAQLDPGAKRSVVSVASRREMIRRQWRDPHSSLDRHYGLGIMSGKTGDWEWFGHGGAFQGFISRTVVVPDHAIAASIVTNAIDGLANQWSDGVMQILQAFARHGTPSAGVRSWTGRWWTLWGATDLVPMGDKVMVASPALMNPFMDASELAISSRDRGRIGLANGFGSHGESVRRVRGRGGKVGELWLGGTRLLPEHRVVAEIGKRYALASRKSRS